MPHKCIQVSEEGFLGSTYTKTDKVLITAAVVFVARPTEWASVVQGLFFDESGAHTHRIAKNTFSPIGIPFIRGSSGNR